MSSSLIQPFLERVAVPLRPAFSSMVDLEHRLAELVAGGRARWPKIQVDAGVFAAFVAERLPHDRDAVEALSTMRAAELYLTCACAQGSTAALSAFDSNYIGEVELALRRMRVTPAQVDEIKQMVRHKLFVGSTEAPGKIADYSGRGDLRRWVRSIAVRIYLNEVRRGQRMVPMADDQLLHSMSSAEDDPELRYMKERYRTEFRDAFIRAVALLEDRQQTLLRYHHVDGLNIDEIGAIYRVHRVTAYRWLEKARESLVQQVQKLLTARLQVEQREFDSILRLIRSQLHLSLVRYLGQPAQPGNEDTATAAESVPAPQGIPAAGTTDSGDES